MTGFSSDGPGPVTDAELDDLSGAEFDAFLRGVVEGEQRGRDREDQAYADGLLDGAAVRRPPRSAGSAAPADRGGDGEHR